MNEHDKPESTALAEYWDADTSHQVIDDLKNLTDWVKALKGPF